MGWIIAALIAYVFISQQPAGVGASGSVPGPGMTNQTGGNPITTVVAQIGTIATDITGAPTTSANNSVGVATPNSPPNYQTGAPAPVPPVLSQPQFSGKFQAIV